MDVNTLIQTRLNASMAGVNARLSEISAETGLRFGTLLESSIVGSEPRVTLNPDFEALSLQDSTALQAARESAVAALSPSGKYPDTYDEIILAACERYDVSPALVKAVIRAESAYNPAATSSAGAMGLMQLMPGTAAGLGVTDAYDPEQNIDGGVRYLSNMLTRSNGDVRLALASYNWGPGAVSSRGLTDLSEQGQWDRLPTSTQGYINRIGAYIADLGGAGF